MLLLITVGDTILNFLCAFFLPERIETSTVGPEISLGLSCVTEFRQTLQVQSHLEIPGILVQLGHIQRT